MTAIFHICTVIPLLMVVPGRTDAGENKDFDLGGLRQVRAVVEASGDMLEVEVSFIPVRCFDRSTNQRVNQHKAQGYALQAAAQYLGLSGQSFSVEGVKRMSCEMLNDRWMARFAFPKASVQVESGVAAGRDSLASGYIDILSRHDDFLDTVQAIDRREIALPTGSSEEIFNLAVSNLEEQQVCAYQNIAREIESDAFLLDIEKQDLLGEIKRHQSQFVERLTRFVQEETGRAP